MFKSLDDIMVINDGFNPNSSLRYYCYSGGLGYKPTPFNMVGGTMNDVYNEKYTYNKKNILHNIFDDKIETLDEYLEDEEEKKDIEDKEYLEGEKKNIEDKEYIKKMNKYKSYYNLKKEKYNDNINTLNFLKIDKIGSEMIGGMAFQNINTGNLDHELFEKYGVDNMNDLIDFVMNSNLNDKEKYNFLLKEGTDILIDLKKKAQISNNNELEKDVNDSSSKIIGLLNDFKDKGYKKSDDQKELLKAIKNDKINDEINPHYDLSFSTAKQSKDTFTEQSEERGNIVEDDLTKNNIILEIIDDDNSTAYNTKDLNAYNLDFLNALIKMELGNPDFKNLTNVNQIPSQMEKLLYDKFLQYVPVDIIKDNTIWEIKSFNKSITPNNDKQMMSETKLKGFENKFWVDLNQRLGNGYSIKATPYSYDFKYIDNGSNKKVDNIYFKFKTPISFYGKPTDKKFDYEIPIFKTNNNGFDYYWLYDNKDKIGYINPLKEDNFKKYNKQLNNPNTKVNDKGKKIIEVKNEDIRIMPYSYAKTLKDFKSDNKPLNNINKLEKNLFKKTLRVQNK